MKKSLLLPLFVLSFFVIQAQNQDVINHQSFGLSNQFSLFGPYIKPTKKEPIVYKSSTNIQILDSNLYTVMDDSTGTWINNTKTYYTYDATGINTKKSSQTWDNNTLVWNNSLSADYTYDVNKEIIQEIDYTWDGTKWVNYIKYEYTRDNTGNITLFTNYTWDGTKWVNYIKYDYFYNGANLESITIYKWVNNAWAVDGGFEYKFDTKNRVESYIYFIWDNGAFANYAQVFYTYNGNDKIIKTLEQWFNGNEGWVDNKTFEFNIAANNDLLSVEESYWNRVSWVKLTRKEYKYNQQYALSDLYKPFEWSDNSFNHQLLQRSVFIKTDEIARDTFYYRTGTSSSVKNVNLTNAFIVYPNPATDQIQIKSTENLPINTINIFDIQGKLVYTKNSNFDEAISVKNMAKGIYMVEINTNQHTERNKITIQ